MFYLQYLLSDTKLSWISKVPDSSSTWVLARSLLVAGDALPGLGITQSNELISCPAHVGLPGAELEVLGPHPALRGGARGKLWLLFLHLLGAAVFEVHRPVVFQTI